MSYSGNGKFVNFSMQSRGFCLQNIAIFSVLSLINTQLITGEQYA